MDEQNHCDISKILCVPGKDIYCQTYTAGRRHRSQLASGTQPEVDYIPANRNATD